MEKDIDLEPSYFVVPILSLIAVIVVYLNAAKVYNVVDVDSPGFLLALLTSLPYALTFAFSFFAKNETHRKAFYAALGLLAFMTGFEWLGPRSPQMRDVYSIIWFLQTVFVVPFLIYTIKTEESV